MTAELNLHEPNPLHTHSGPADAWSTVNTRENVPGVMSPLGATVWLPICDLAINGAFADLGVLRRRQVRVATTPGEATSAVFYGRYTGNVNYFRRMSDLIPGTSGAVSEEQIFGSIRADAPDYTSRRRYGPIAVKAPVALALSARRVRVQAELTTQRWRTATSGHGPVRPALEQLESALHLVEQTMRIHLTSTFVAQAVFDGLAKLAIQAGRPGLHLELSSGYAGTVETAMVNALQRVAAGERSLSDFLADYGYRCTGELEISTPSWREDPGPVERMLLKLGAAAAPPDPRERTTTLAQARATAERTLLAALPPLRRPSARTLMRLARTFMPLREEGKAALARSLDVVRMACRARGRELVDGGVIERPDDVFYLTVDEIRAESSPDARSGVAHRRALRHAYESMDVPGFWIGDPQPVLASPASATRVDTLRGVPAASGVVQGHARVIIDGDHSDELEPDEILVCRTTDPSWAAAFSLAAGLVIDIGSPSSHGAIVAREMGLPCVIDTGTGTTQIQTGDHIRVDGNQGLVTILAPAAARP